MKNILIVVLSLSITTQTLCSSWEDAQKSLPELRTNIAIGINDALTNGYSNLSASLDSTVEFVVSNGTEEITTATSDYINQYNAIKQSAEGVDITVCLNSFEDAITNLGPDELTSFEECVQSAIDPALAYISSASEALISQFWENRAILQEKNVLKCTSFDENCLQIIIAAIVKISARTRGEIENAVQATVGRFGQYSAQITVCRDKFVSQNSGKGKSLVEGFKSCVDAHINPDYK